MPGAQGLINDNCNAQEIEGKGRKGPGANIDLEDDQMERGLASMDEDFPEGRQENAETESSSQSVSTDTSSINVASEVVGGSPDGETESPESIPANDESLRLVDVTGLNRRLALFLHKREDESPHEVGPMSILLLMNKDFYISNQPHIWKPTTPGDPATLDGNDGASFVTFDGKPEHGEDCDDGQRARAEQQDGGGHRRRHCRPQTRCEARPGWPPCLHWTFPEAR